MSYSMERREAILRKMLPPNPKGVPEISLEEGIPEATLYLWRKAARAKGFLLPDGDSTPAGWSSADKFAAVVETAAMNEEQKAAYCRQRGLYPEQIAQWREACENANDWDASQQRRQKDEMRAVKKHTAHLERELQRKEKALAEAAALLVLKKKIAVLWGESEDE